MRRGWHSWGELFQTARTGDFSCAPDSCFLFQSPISKPPRCGKAKLYFEDLLGAWGVGGRVKEKSGGREGEIRVDRGYDLEVLFDGGVEVEATKREELVSVSFVVGRVTELRGFEKRPCI